MTLAPKLQLQISGTWTDATRYDANTRVLNEPGISVTRGTGSTQDRTPASTCSWTWQDPNGVYVNDNPRSPYYGVLPRNTPVRAWVPRSAVALLIAHPGDAARSETSDKAALDVVGDLDVRIDVEARYWRRFGSNSGKIQVLCGKWEEGGQRSWHLRVSETGFVTFSFSTTGANSLAAASTVAIPTTGRIAIRATMDVDNGAAGHTTTFYTSDTISGTWTALGTPVTSAGVIALFSSSADLEVGSINNGTPSGFSALMYDFLGRIYSFELYNGIAGSLVAQANYAGQPSGSTGFADGLGNTFVLIGGAEITNADYRFYGELASPTQLANVSAGGVGQDVQVAGQAGGVIQRLTTNETPLTSPIYHVFNTYGANGWWPCEDNSGATLASSAIDGGAPATLADITFSGYDTTLAGSAGVLTCGGTGPQFTGTCKIVTTTTETHFIGYFKFPTVPLSAQTLFSIFGNGTVKRWDFIVTATNYTLKGYDSTGALTVTKDTLFGTGADPTNWIAYHLQLTNVAGTISIKSEWQVIGAAGGDIGYTQNGVGTVSYAGTNGIFTSVLVQGVAALSGVRLAHLMTTTQTGLIFFTVGTSEPFARFSRGYAGETADARFLRVCTEQGLKYLILGLLGSTEQMGPQPIDSIMNVLYEVQEVDGGLISEARDWPNCLEYRTRTFMLNQYGLSLSYTASKHLSGRFASTPDNTNVKNDITLTRRNGGSARAVQTIGPMSNQLPPNGIGSVPDQPTINPYLDTRLPYLAGWALLRGTWPEARYTAVSIELSRSPYTASTALSWLAMKTDVGDLITVTDMPQFTTADSVLLQARGLTETFNNFTWGITYNTAPAGPYRCSELSTVTGEELRADSARDTAYVGQTQLAAATSSATSLTATTLSGPIMTTTATDPTQFPFDIFQAGERITVTAIVGATSPQTLTVTRAVNGVTKAVAANTPLTAVQYFNVTL